MEVHMYCFANSHFDRRTERRGFDVSYGNRWQPLQLEKRDSGTLCCSRMLKLSADDILMSIIILHPLLRSAY